MASKRLIALFTGMMLGQQAGAAELQLSDVLAQIITAHPKVMAMREQGAQAQAKIDKADAAFDPYFSQKVSSRVSGYYSGDVLTTGVSKPLAFMNGEVFTQYQLADGDFPVYEAEYETLSAGEFRVGISLSLLQGRDTDARRTGLQTARLSLQEWQARYNASVNDQLYVATSTYLKWYESSLKLKALGEMTTALKAGETALKRRVEQGDAARIALDDYQNSLLEVELLKADTEQAQAIALAKLRYFMTSPGTLAAPGEHRPDWPFLLNETRIGDLRRALNGHPLQVSMQAGLNKQQAEYDLARNNLLPKLDMQASVGRDVGSGVKSLEGTETKVGLSFSYPLGNRKARAEESALAAKVREVQFKIEDLRQKLIQQFDANVANWQQSKKVLDLRQQARALAERLQNAERTRFNAGDADMFILNARQTKLIKARMDAIKAHVARRQAELDLYYAAAALDSALATHDTSMHTPGLPIDLSGAES
ncbi:TolC family protein [Salinimonas lutimaris]|uniref:TolC family protein n=1 Tax=Salinimonas lutimaris TaxID=914153 RepID=UPI0010C1514A|nr:TolC family protein [Salinimonas lutimaris]